MLHISPIRLIFLTCYCAHSGLCVKSSVTESSTVQPFQHENQNKRNKIKRNVSLMLSCHEYYSSLVNIKNRIFVEYETQHALTPCPCCTLTTEPGRCHGAESCNEASMLWAVMRRQCGLFRLQSGFRWPFTRIKHDVLSPIYWTRNLP